MSPANLAYTYATTKRLKSGARTYWRFRRDGLDCPLPGDPRTDPAAMRKYADLVQRTERAAGAAAEPRRQSFEWLARQYLASAEFAQLAPDTQTDYTKVIERRLLPALGPERFDCITRAAVKAVRDAVLAEGLRPRSANKVKQLASLLYSWAEDEDLLPAGFTNPGRALKKLKEKPQAYEIWSAEEIALFLGHAPAHLVTAVMLALYTGQRVGDVATMHWADVQALDATAPMIRVRQNKTGEALAIPCHPRLAQHLRQVRNRFGGPIVRGADARPITANALSSAMYRAVQKIDGMPPRSFHGLRYAAAGALEAVGCSVVEIASIVGHRTYQMAMKYAEQRKAAEAAMARLERHA